MPQFVDFSGSVLLVLCRFQRIIWPVWNLKGPVLMHSNTYVINRLNGLFGSDTVAFCFE